MPLPEEYKKFTDITKLMLKKKLSRNVETLKTYRTKLVIANNTIVEYINNHYASANRSNQALYDATLETVRKKVLECLTKLQCTHELKSLTELIDIETIGEPTPRTKEPQENPDDSGSETFENAENTGSNNDILVTQNPISTIKPSTSQTISNVNSDSNRNSPRTPLTLPPPITPRQGVNVTMAEPNPNHNFLRLAAGQINKNYAGDPLALASFIDSLELLESMATTAELTTILFSFAKTKLEGKAREIITTTVINLTQLKNALRTHIKPENSHVVEGRILSLKFNPNHAEECSKKAEELADALKRTLIVEGVSAEKANQMTIDKTIEVCRRNTNSPMIKSVLEASTFETAKDVVAKLITQTDKTKAETQILSYNRPNNNNRGRGNHVGRGRGYQNNNYNHGNQNGHFHNPSNNRNFNRGRGYARGRGQFNNNRGRGAFGYNRYNNQGQFQNGNNIRAFSGNDHGTPVHGQMGPPPDNPQAMHLSQM